MAGSGLIRPNEKRFAGRDAVVVALRIIAVAPLDVARHRIFHFFSENRFGLSFINNGRNVDGIFRRKHCRGHARKHDCDADDFFWDRQFHPPDEPVPPGSVMATGSSTRLSSASGSTFFARQISRTVWPVFALSFAIS